MIGGGKGSAPASPPLRQLPFCNALFPDRPRVKGPFPPPPGDHRAAIVVRSDPVEGEAALFPPCGCSGCPALLRSELQLFARPPARFPGLFRRLRGLDRALLWSVMVWLSLFGPSALALRRGRLSLCGPAQPSQSLACLLWPCKADNAAFRPPLPPAAETYSALKRWPTNGIRAGLGPVLLWCLAQCRYCVPLGAACVSVAAFVLCPAWLPPPSFRFGWACAHRP